MVMSKANGVTSPEQAKPHLSAGSASIYLTTSLSDPRSI
jgi:hypothetical protein